MKKLLVISIIWLSGLGVSAQSQEALRKIEAARIALITERLELTPEQAEKFWPIYREYSEKQREIRKEFQELKQNYDPSQASEEESKTILNLGYQIKERQLELDKTYAQRMQQIVTSRQLMNLRKAEEDFRNMLMKRIREQSIQRQRSENDKQRTYDQMQQRRNN
ncbi:MAG: hypothetical protein ABJG41_12380 [Cyclobacteriaceae bacterium]